jgi:hypothetical protein
MRKGVRNPTTVEEAKARIYDALFQMRFPRGQVDLTRFEHDVALRHPKGARLPEDLDRSIQEEMDRRREKLTLRVERRYRRTRSIALVCALIRRSPVFLRDQWVNEVILERRKTILCQRDRKAREKALEELEQISLALVSESIPSWSRRNAGKSRRLSARRPSTYSLGQPLDVISRYTEYVEMGSCLKAIKQLLDFKGRKPEAVASDLASEFGLDAALILECWKGRTSASGWALSRLAQNVETTPEGARRQLAEAKRRVGQEVTVAKRVQVARDGLREDRSRKAIALQKAGGSGFHRRY